MNEKKIEDIKNALREVVQMLVQSGQPLSEDMKLKLAQVMEHAAERIQQLRQSEAEGTEELPPIEEVESEQAEAAQSTEPAAPSPSVPTGGPVPPLEKAPHESSNVNALRFDPDKQQLFIKFQDKYPGQNGPVYSYQGVPPYIFDIIRRGAVAPKTSGSNAWHTWKEGVTPSHGASVNAILKAGGFQYQRIK